MKAELSPASGGFGGMDAGEAAAKAETSGKEIARKSEARGADPSKQSNLRRLFQDDVFERAARRPLVALG